MNRSLYSCAKLALLLCGGSLFQVAYAADPAKKEGDLKPIAIAEIKRTAPVNFEKEILPIFNRSCLACHNATKAENSLVLETTASILKGGDSGPAVVAKKSGESLLLRMSAHQTEPVMPPADNKVGAAALKPEELGLLKLWIDEGATGDVTQKGGPVKWQPLPPGINPIYAVALTPDGQYAACGRANQIFVYHAPSGKLVTRLTDPALVKSGLYKAEGVAHLDLVQSLAFNPEGNLLASGAYREIKLWRRPSDVRKAELAGLAEPAAVVALSGDGKWAATGDAAGKIELWDLATNKVAKTLAGHTAAVSALKFLPGNEKLVSGSQDKSVRVWNLASGASVSQIDTPAPVNAVEILAAATKIAAGGADNLIRVYPLPMDGAPAADMPAPQEFKGHAQPITALAASPTDAKVFYSAAAENGVREWNLDKPQAPVRQLDHGGPVTALVVRGDGLQVASTGGNGLIKLWTAKTGQPWTLPGNQPVLPMKGDQRAQARVSEQERVVASVTAKVADDKKNVTDAQAKVKSTEETIKTANTAKETAAKTLVEKKAAVKAPADAKIAADKELETASAENKAAMTKAEEAKAAAEKDSGNRDLAKAKDDAAKAAADAEKKFKEVEKKAQDAATAASKAMQESLAAEAANMAAEQAAANSVTNHQKAVEAVPVAEAAVKVSEAALAAAQEQLKKVQEAATAQEKPIRSLAYSADNLQLASGGENQLVRTWSADTGAAIETYAAHQGPVLNVAFAADGGLLSTAADKKAILWDTTPAWTLERTIGNVDSGSALVDRVLALGFSPDGKTLASGGGEPSRSGELKIWNVADGALVRAIADAHSDTVFGVEFSPDGKYLASAAADRFLKVFDVASGKLARSYEGHTHHVLGVSWRADGKVLASCGADNVIKVWDFSTGDQIRTTPPAGKEVTSIRFVASTPKALVSAGDKSVRLINTENGNSEKNMAGSTDFVYSVSVAADGKTAVGGGQDSNLFVWNIENGQTLRTLEAPGAKTMAAAK